MATVGVRDLARRTSSIIKRVTEGREPMVVTHRGRPVAIVLPVKSDEFENYVLAHAPAFVDGIEEAEAELAAGETLSSSGLRAELEQEENVAAR